MLVWFIYDISKDKIRNKIVKMAQEKGLYRVQKSVFLGEINKNRLDEIIMQSEKLIEKEKDSVYIFPICSKDFKASVFLGQAFDEDLITDEIKALFL